MSEGSEAERIRAEWLADKPACVQEMAREFPMGSRFESPTATFYLIGYYEPDELLISAINPRVDWQRAVDEHFHVSVAQMRTSMARARN